jgi:hypothetical protein
VATEAHHANLITLLISVEQQGHDGAFGGDHAVPCAHGTTGIHGEEHKRTRAGFSHLFAQI